MQLVERSEAEAFSIAGGQQLRLPLLTVPPDGSNGMDDVSGWQITPASDHRLTGLTTSLVSPYRSTFLQNGRSSSSVDGSIHSTTPQQARIGRIHDRVDLLVDDVALYEFEFDGALVLSNQSGAILVEKQGFGNQVFGAVRNPHSHFLITTVGKVVGAYYFRFEFHLDLLID